MKEINRIFKAKDRFGADMEFELIKPTLQIETEGERCYKAAYAQALAQGVYPREKLRSVMKDFGMWTEEDEMKYKTIVGKLAIFHTELQKLEQAGNDEKCQKIATEMSNERNKMWELFLIQHSVFMNSAEAFAELVKAEAMMAACTRIKASGVRYWKTYSEFVREKEENTKSTVYIAVVEVQSNLLESLRHDIEGKYPENKYLKDVKNSVLDRAIEEDVQKEVARRKEEALGEMDSENSGESSEGSGSTNESGVAEHAS